MQIVVFMLFLIFTFKDPNLAENLTHLANTPKIVGPHRVHGACLLHDPLHLVKPGKHQVSKGVVAEFLKVTVSRSCDGAKFVLLCAKSGDVHGQTKNLCILTFFVVVFLIFHTY